MSKKNIIKYRMCDRDECGGGNLEVNYIKKESVNRTESANFLSAQWDDD